ncbi:MAG TPA: DUF1194 domain-containing protein [Phycisphaerae bacterium]|nr:DUF1194 domain-containing protein [Phycisphaerae bacterium]
MIRKLGIVLAAAVAAGSLLMPARAATIHVDLELALVVDVSGSVDSTEFALQQTGYANAFKSASVQNDIAQLQNGAAVALIYFDQGQYIGVNWTLLQTGADSFAFGNAIAAAARPGSGNTGVGDAITYAKNQILGNNYTGGREVIDVSGDGSTNVGSDAATARNAALAAGVAQINGLPILGSEANLDTWYAANVQGGSGSFTIAASGFSTFQSAVQTKIEAEITGTNPTVPLPAAVWGGLAMLAGAAGMSRFSKRKFA